MLNVSFDKVTVRLNGHHVIRSSMDKIWNQITSQLIRNKMVKLNCRQYEEIVIVGNRRGRYYAVYPQGKLNVAIADYWPISIKRT